MERLGSSDGDVAVVSAPACRYWAVQRLAKAMDFIYKPVATLAAEASVEDIANRASAISRGPQLQREPTAVLGLTDEPSLPISEVLELYFDKLAVSEICKKSDDRTLKWKLQARHPARRRIAGSYATSSARLPALLGASPPSVCKFDEIVQGLRSTID